MSSLRITLNTPNTHIYFPGQKLSGKVVYVARQQQSLKEIVIAFRGKIDTRFRENHNRFTETITLFHLREQLFTGPFDVQPQTFEWEFEFLIPTHIKYNRQQGALNQNVIIGGLSRTPPTFYHEHMKFDHSASAEIKYKLVAQASVGGLFRDQTEELPITIRRVRDTRPPSVSLEKNEFLPSISWSSSSLRQQKHSFKQKMQHAFSDNPDLKTPCIAFRAFVHMPQMLAADQNTPVGFSILHKRLTANDPVAPTLQIMTLDLTLKSENKLVVSRNSMWGNIYSDNISTELGHFLKFEPKTLSLAGDQVLLTTGMRLQDWGVGVSPWSYMPNFRTYTVSREHRMRVDVTVKHVESGHIFKLRTEFPFAVLDQYVPNSGDVERERVHRPVQMSDVDLELPAYDDDVAPPDAADHYVETDQVITQSAGAVEPRRSPP